MSRAVRRAGRAWALVPLLLGLLCLPAGVRVFGAEEDKARRERFDELVESLSGSSARRDRAVEAVYSELRGQHSREMHELLRESLSRRNSLILLGVVEILAMHGDPGDVAGLEALVSTSSQLEVKARVLRLLPAFCLTSERARFNFIRYAVGYARTAPAGVLAPLRSPPLTRRGRLDPTLERLQVRVVRCLASQFDPVAAALRYLDDIVRQGDARRAVTHFAGGVLGNDPARWPGIWAAQGAKTATLVPDEIEEIRLTALQSLSDMGAEGLPEVLEGFRTLESAGGDVLPQAVFETLAVMCRSAFEDYPALASMQFDPGGAAEADNWRRRRYESGVRVAAHTVEAAAGSLVEGADAGVFQSASDALGAALSYPADYPDPDGVLAAAAAKGGGALERMAVHPGISREKRASVLAALGEIGSVRAVAAIDGILHSPYCSPEGGVEAAHLAETAIDTLARTATAGRPGTEQARAVLLDLLSDARVYPAQRSGAPPVGLSHMALWRLQRLAGSNSIVFEPEAWKGRLGW